VKESAKLVTWIGPDWSADELFSNFSIAKDYLGKYHHGILGLNWRSAQEFLTGVCSLSLLSTIGIIIPIGISATATTLMCLVSAKEAGDPYPVRETLITDGIGTMIASFFGSPFGTVIYIGHPAHKRSGAKVGYSLFNGIIYL